MAKKAATTTVKVTVKTENNQVLELRTKAEQVVEKALALAVTSEEEYKEATDFLLQAKQVDKLIEEEKNKVVKPLKQALKVEQDRWKPIEKAIEEINEIVRPKMKRFLDEKEAKALKAMEKLEAKIASGAITNPDTIEKQFDKVYAMAPQRTVHTGNGSAGASKIKTMHIVDPSLVPDEFWIIDEVKLRDAVLKKGLEVPGTKVTYENSIRIK